MHHDKWIQILHIGSPLERLEDVQAVPKIILWNVCSTFKQKCKTWYSTKLSRKKLSSKIFQSTPLKDELDRAEEKQKLREKRLKDKEEEKTTKKT